MAALDDWALVAFALRKNDVCEQVLAVARLAAPDPEGGDRLRRFDLWQDRQALELAKRVPLKSLSPHKPNLVGALLWKGTPIGESWLRQAQAQYPGDFWLNFELANALLKSNPAEAAGYYWAALAVRPNTSVAYNNLGNALFDQKKLSEAIAAYEKAIELDPRFALAYSNLCNGLLEQKMLPEAIAACQKAIDLDPKFADAYLSLGVAFHGQKRLSEAMVATLKGLEFGDLKERFLANYNLVQLPVNGGTIRKP